MAWTPEDKEKLVAEYQASEPTPENTIEIVEQLAEKWEQSVNAIRLILSKEGVYVKKVAVAGPSGGAKESTGAKRVSKQDSIDELVATLTAQEKEVDMDILSKLTGKAAIYFNNILK